MLILLLNCTIRDNMTQERATNGKKIPTPKQKKFAKVFVKTGNKTEAYKEAYNTGNMLPNTINREALVTATNPPVVKEIARLMDRMGLDDKSLLKVHTQGLTATKLQGNELIESPDYAVRHKYLETAYKLKGHTDGDKDKGGDINIAFIVNEETK